MNNTITLLNSTHDIKPTKACHSLPLHEQEHDMSNIFTININLGRVCWRDLSAHHILNLYTQTPNL
jgi:hypothetical protein